MRRILDLGFRLKPPTEDALAGSKASIPLDGGEGDQRGRRSYLQLEASDRAARTDEARAPGMTHDRLHEKGYAERCV